MSAKLSRSDGSGPGGEVAPDENNPAREVLPAYLRLLAKLEASLEASRAALLALDLHGIEGGTTEQIRLLRELTAAKAQLGIERAGGALAEHLGSLGSATSEMWHEIGLSARRILAASRLHAAILARCREKSRVMANLLAGASVNYDPVTLREGARAHAVAARGNGESQLCRA